MTPSGGLPAGSPSLRCDSAERPFARDCQDKFVKSQYEFACDFRFLSERCRKATVRVKDRCNQVTVARNQVPTAV